MLELFNCPEFASTVHKAMELTVKSIVAEQKHQSGAIINNKEKIQQLKKVVAVQQADIEALKGKQKTHQNINILRITGLDCQGKDVNSCFLHLAQELSIQSIKQSDFSARTLAPKIGQQPPLPGQDQRISSPFTDLVTNQTNNKSIIIVEFYNFWVCRQVYAAKKGLKGIGSSYLNSCPKKQILYFTNADS